MDEPEPITDPRLLCDERGVDRSLIRYMLRMSAVERLRHMQGFLESVLEIRRINERPKVR